jgi:hypothetical protein
MDFQKEYDDLTKTIDDTLSSQVSSSLTWVNIPGTLVKASSSPAGYAWGYNTNNQVFTCQLPCTGNWQLVDLSSYGATVISDITTDYTNVYVLTTGKAGNKLLLVNLASNRGQWNILNIPFAASNIFSTSTYLWAQDDANNKQKCAKPCTTGNWLVSPEKNVKITSSSYTELYGKDGAGNAFKTDENMTTGWAPIKGFANNTWQSIIGQGGQTSIYGIDTKSNVYSCGEMCAFEDDVKPVDTGGYAPLNLTSDPQNKNLMMTATTSGDKGNIFTRVDKPDYSSILNMIDPLDQKRDRIVDDVEREYANQTKTETANKQLNTISDFFNKNLGISTHTIAQNENQSSLLSQQIEQSQQEIDKMSNITAKLIALIVVMVVVSGIYLLGEPILGQYIHAVALLAIMVGIFFTIYY